MRLKVHSPASLAVYRLTVPDNSLQIHYVHVVYTDSRGEKMKMNKRAKQELLCWKAGKGTQAYPIKWVLPVPFYRCKNRLVLKVVQG